MSQFDIFSLVVQLFWGFLFSFSLSSWSFLLKRRKE